MRGIDKALLSGGNPHMVHATTKHKIYTKRTSDTGRSLKRSSSEFRESVLLTQDEKPNLVRNISLDIILMNEISQNAFNFIPGNIRGAQLNTVNDLIERDFLPKDFRNLSHQRTVHKRAHFLNGEKQSRSDEKLLIQTNRSIKAT